MASSHPTSSSWDLHFLSWVTSTDGHFDGFTSQTFNVLHCAGIAVTFVWILTLALTPVCQRCLSLISSYFHILYIKRIDSFQIWPPLPTLLLDLQEERRPSFQSILQAVGNLSQLSRSICQRKGISIAAIFF